MVAGQIASTAAMLLASALTFGTSSVYAQGGSEMDVPGIPGSNNFIPRASPLSQDYKRANNKVYSVNQDYSGGSTLSCFFLA